MLFNILQTIIYQQYSQHMRSTTSISLYSAIYYASGYAANYNLLAMLLVYRIYYSCFLLQITIYQQCYQYMRSTTYLSLYLAIYYALLATTYPYPHKAAIIFARGLPNQADQQRMPLAEHSMPISSSRLPTIAADPFAIGDKESDNCNNNINFFKGTMQYILSLFFLKLHFYFLILLIQHICFNVLRLRSPAPCYFLWIQQGLENVAGRLGLVVRLYFGLC